MVRNNLVKNKRNAHCKLFILFMLTSLIISQFTFNSPSFAATLKGVNLALGKTATASVSYSTETPGKAVNGTYSDIHDKWCTGYTSQEKWLKLDLGNNYDINRWVVYHATTRETSYPEYNTKNFRLQSSFDGVTWKDRDIVTENASSITDRRVATFSARYIRLYIDQAQQNNNSCARIYELQLYYEPINIALNKTATASCNKIYEEPYHAVEGIIGTKWGTGYTTQEKWLKLDLGQVYTINRWKIYHAGDIEGHPEYTTRNFRLQKSQDGVTWYDVDVVTGNTQSITDRTTSLFSTRYVRLYIDQATQNDNSCARIWEFELFNDYYVSKPGNLALNKTVSANNYVYGELPALTVDGSYDRMSNKKWSSGYGFGNNSWLKVDLGSVKNISKWVVISAGLESSSYITKTFKLQASNDGNTWYDIDRVVDNQQNVCERLVKPFASRYVRLFIENAGIDNCARIYEFELYDN